MFFFHVFPYFLGITYKKITPPAKKSLKLKKKKKNSPFLNTSQNSEKDGVLEKFLRFILSDILV